MKYMQVLVPVFRMYQVCGFAPFPIPFDETNGIRKDKQRKWFIYYGVLIVYLISMVIINMYLFKELYNSDSSEMLTYLTFIITTVTRVLALAIIVESFMMRNKHISLLQHFGHVDQIILGELGVEIDFKKMRRTGIIWMVIWIVQISVLMTIVIVDILIEADCIWDGILLFFYTIPLMVPSFRYFHVIHYVLLLGSRFEIVNKRIEQICSLKDRLNTDRSHKGANSESTERNIYNELVSMRRVYHNLWEITLQLNNMFRVSLLLMIGTSFSVLLVNSYRNLVWLITPDTTKLSVILTFFLWTIVHSFYFIKISYTCYNVAQEVREIILKLLIVI